MYQLLGHCSGVMDQILPKGPKVIFSRCSKIQFAFSEWLRLVKNQSPGSLRQYLTTNVLWGEFQRITAVQTVNHGLFWITSFPACQCPHRTDHLPPFLNWKELFWMKIWKNLDMMLRSKFEPEGLFQTWETVSWGSGRSRDGTAPSLQKESSSDLIFISWPSWSSVTSWLMRPALSPAMQESDLWENLEVSLRVLTS